MKATATLLFPKIGVYLYSTVSVHNGTWAAWILAKQLVIPQGGQGSHAGHRFAVTSILVVISLQVNFRPSFRVLASAGKPGSPCRNPEATSTHSYTLPACPESV